MIKNSDITSEEEEEDNKKTAQASRCYVTHLKGEPSVDTGLDLLSLPVRKAAKKRVEFLFDTGATISLIKLKTFKGDVKIYEKEIKLIGITDHAIMTLGKAYLHMDLKDGQIKHPVYVIRDNAPIEYKRAL